MERDKDCILEYIRNRLGCHYISDLRNQELFVNILKEVQELDCGWPEEAIDYLLSYIRQDIDSR